MLSVFVATMLLGILPPSGPGTAAEPAYEAEVVGSNVFASSGPGANYYPTQLLRAGQIVTVTGAATGDWVAILPPRESFSWIPRESVQENTDGTATVLLDKTALGIGSVLSDARHVHQVVLNKGDRVQIVDEQTLAGKNGPERWYKVVPPAGERRYLPSNSVRPVAVGGTASAPAASTYRNVSQTTSEPLAARVGSRVIPPAEPMVKSTDAPKLIEPSASQAGMLAAPPVKDDPSKPIAERAASVKRQLDEMRTRRPEQWNLDSARRVLSEIQKSAKTDGEKAAVRETSQLEQQMRNLWERYTAISKRRETFLQQDRELSKMLRQAQERGGRFVPRFDAEGTLRRAAVTIDRQLAYVLEDASGVATHYVIFPPGLSGENYIGRRVGLMGKITRRDHVPVPRIDVDQTTPLDP